jgi:hypothetical protein
MAADKRGQKLFIRVCLRSSAFISVKPEQLLRTYGKGLIDIHLPCCYTFAQSKSDNDDEQEEYAVSTPPREPANRCEAGASVAAEWAWELQSQPIADCKLQIAD